MNFSGPQFYKLIGRLPVPCSFEQWLQWAAEFEQVRVLKQEHVGPLWISTVFLGIDHNLFGGEPHLFETMIFDDFNDAYQTRCTTWEQAEFMHEAAVTEARRRIESAKVEWRYSEEGKCTDENS